MSRVTLEKIQQNPKQRSFQTLFQYYKLYICLHDPATYTTYKFIEPPYFDYTGTGASCIYPLLGAKLNGWRFLATEVDESSMRYAQENIERNGFSDLIKGICFNGRLRYIILGKLGALPYFHCSVASCQAGHGLQQYYFTWDHALFLWNKVTVP